MADVLENTPVLTQVLEKLNVAHPEPALRNALFDLVAEIKEMERRIRFLERRFEDTEG